MLVKCIKHDHIAQKVIPPANIENVCTDISS